jgi:hypothetical protein
LAVEARRGRLFAGWNRGFFAARFRARRRMRQPAQIHDRPY